MPRSVPGQSVEEYNYLFICGLIKTENKRFKLLSWVWKTSKHTCIDTVLGSSLAECHSGCHTYLCSQVGKTTESEWLHRSSRDTGSEVTSSFGFARPETEVHTYHIKADLAL